MLIISLSHHIPFLLVFYALICDLINFTCFQKDLELIFLICTMFHRVLFVCRSVLVFSLACSNFFFVEVKHTLHFRHEVDDRVIPLVQTFERSAN